MKKLRVGDPVTFVVERLIKDDANEKITTGLQLRRSTVFYLVNRTPTFVVNDAVAADPNHTHWLDAEGVTWIRGHTDKRSSRGKALLVAYALREPQLVSRWQMSTYSLSRSTSAPHRK